ncbi:hypothetical protein BDN72DRAFT_740254, partial [Pluteus cervinus]
RGDAPRCHPDTRKAVKQSLILWPDNLAAGPVRWIYGWAGTGKTTIAQTMAEYWAQEGRLVASFFFSRSSEDTSTIHKFKETIAHQLLQILSFPDEVLHLFHREELSTRGWAAIVDALSSLPPQPPMIIILDGLDECHNFNEVATLLRDILGSAYQLQHSVKFLISCRPERPIEKSFDQFDPGNSYRIHLGQSEGDNDDLRTFLRVSFERIHQ